MKHTTRAYKVVVVASHSFTQPEITRLRQAGGPRGVLDGAPPNRITWWANTAPQASKIVASLINLNFVIEIYPVD